MNEEKGWICLHRKLKKWKWYHDINTRITFIHCLLSANYEDGYFEGRVIKKGSFITSREKLSKEIGISQQSLRTALNHLKSTNELTIETTTKYTIITVINYNSYQEANQVFNQQLTNDQPTTNHNITNNSSSSYELIEKNFGRPLAPLEYEKINSWLKDYEEDIILYAVNIAVMNNKKTFNYVSGILNNWKVKGFKTLQEIKDNENYGIFAKEAKENKPVKEIFDYNWID